MADIELDFYDQIPEKFCDIKPREIRQVFANPSLVFIKGESEQTLVLSTILHGNEHTSFYVLQKLAHYLKQQKPAKNILIFIGNVYASEKEKRYLEGQLDYNRIWLDGDQDEHRLAQKVKAAIKKHKVFALVDIHNNTGKNPYYACISKVQKQDLYLASLFSRTLVFFEKPHNALSRVFSETYPAITLECGRSGEIMGIEKAYHLVLDILHSKSLDHTMPQQDVSVFHTIASLHILADTKVGFSDASADISFVDNLEDLNFTPLDPGFVLATYKTQEPPIKVIDDEGKDLSQDFFEAKHGNLVLKKKVYPSMFTKDLTVIAQDCLGYFMQSMSLEKLS